MHAPHVCRLCRLPLLEARGSDEIVLGFPKLSIAAASSIRRNTLGFIRAMVPQPV